MKTPTPQHKRQSEGNTHFNQLQTIFHFLRSHVATASMVESITGVPQKNICRYKRDLEKVGKLWEVRKANCLLTGFRAWYLTTDPEKAPKNSSTQLNLF